MFIHEEIQKAVLPLLKKYDLQLIDLLGEMNHAAWELSVLNDAGLQKLVAELNEMPNVKVTGCLEAGEARCKTVPVDRRVGHHGG